MKCEKKHTETDFEQLSDSKIIMMVVEETLSRNRSYEFFKTKRGQELFKKARIVKGFLQDLKNGAKIISVDSEKENVLVTLENMDEKYKRTVFMDKNMYSVFSLKK